MRGGMETLPFKSTWSDRELLAEQYSVYIQMYLI